MRPRQPRIDKVKDNYHTFKMLSYNLFMRPPTPNFTHNNGVDDFKDERLNRFLRVINQFDIICLQEMSGSGEIEIEINENKKFGIENITTVTESELTDVK